jgi:hypothetical protein
MRTTIEYLDAVKARYGLPSDYALGKLLRIPHTTISGYRAKRRFFDDDTALTIATALEVNPMEVIAAANAERAKTPEQKARWIGVMEKFSGSFRNLLSQWDGIDRRVKGPRFVRG